MTFTNSGPNSFQGFLSTVKSNPPAASNLYWIRFRNPPRVFLNPDPRKRLLPLYADGVRASRNGEMYSGPESLQSKLLSYYATDVTVPSRQITTGDAKTVGSMYRYATGTTYSEISVQFILPRTMFTRTYFERWMNYTSNDSTQKVAFYNDYVCSHLDIFKYERGGVTPSPLDWNSTSSVNRPRGMNLRDFKRTSVKVNRCSGVWVLKNAYPFNISNINLNAGPGNLLSMDVSFYYERYRFYVPKDSNLSDVGIDVRLGSTGSGGNSQNNR
jgi:hypothetical protein